MGNENQMRAAEIEKQANNAQRDVMTEKRQGLGRVKQMQKDANNMKNEAMLFKTSSAGPRRDDRNKQRMTSLVIAKRKESKANELKAKAKDLEKQVLKATQDKDFKIKEMYDAARKLRTQA